MPQYPPIPRGRMTTPLLEEPPQRLRHFAPARPRRNFRLIALRFLCVVLGLAAWFTTQYLIGSRPALPPTGHIGDHLLALLAPIHSYLLANHHAANALLIASSAVIDILALFLLANAVFGKSIRPFLGLLL